MIFVLYFLAGMFAMFALMLYFENWAFKHCPTAIVEPMVVPLLLQIAAHHTDIFTRFFERSGTVLAPKELLTANDENTKAFETYQKEMDAILESIRPKAEPLYPEGFKGCEYAKVDTGEKVIRVCGSKDYTLCIESPHTLKSVEPKSGLSFSEYQFVWSTNDRV